MSALTGYNTKITGSVTNEERIYREKFFSQLNKCGYKILNVRFTIACATCARPISRDQIGAKNLHPILGVLVCANCALGHPDQNHCSCCGRFEISSDLTPCSKICHRKTCKSCVLRIKKTAPEGVVCLGVGWTCIFCDLRLLWHDRAVCNAVSLAIPSLKAMQKEKVPNLANEKLFEEIDCIICEDRAASQAFIPCGHVCLCDACLPAYTNKGFNTCPMCMNEYRNIMKVYF